MGFRMELIYVQTRVNGQGSPELALEVETIYNVFKHLIQAFTCEHSWS